MSLSLLSIDNSEALVTLAFQQSFALDSGNETAVRARAATMGLDTATIERLYRDAEDRAFGVTTCPHCGNTYRAREYPVHAFNFCKGGAL